MGELGLAAVVGLLLVKEAGLPVPVPGDLLVLGAGVAAASGGLEPAPTLLVIVAATIAGGLVQFTLLRGRLRARVLGVLRRIGLTDDRVERVAGPVRERGAVGVAVSRMTPGLRIVAIPAAALAAIAPAPFAAGLAVGNGVFVGGHFVLGLALGPAASAVAGSIGLALIALVAGLAVVGLVGWLVIRRRRPGRDRDGYGLEALARAAGDWADAACPACLTLGAVESVLHRPQEA
ncbi:MAG: hypothetical protein L0227_16950 [Chloroflexi bacterium]|nr:hypothetical protein [Chloroflexota bacterium]